jgi:hypothetical protein
MIDRQREDDMSSVVVVVVVPAASCLHASRVKETNLEKVLSDVLPENNLDWLYERFFYLLMPSLSLYKINIEFKKLLNFIFQLLLEMFTMAVYEILYSKPTNIE